MDVFSVCQVTSYVTKTQKIAATVNPLAGLLG